METNTVVKENPAESQIATYEVEIRIEAPTGKVWDALTGETDRWWLSDFRMVSPESRVHLDPRAGGYLIEEQPGGGGLLWYQVQMVIPGKELHLIGHMGKDWGGPTVSFLKISLAGDGKATVFRIQDSLFGNVTESQVASLKEGWRALFGDGLRLFAES